MVLQRVKHLPAFKSIYSGMKQNKLIRRDMPGKEIHPVLFLIFTLNILAGIP